MTGLVGCVNKGVKRSQMAVTIIAVLAILATFVVYSMGSYAGEKDKRAKNTQKIEVIKANIKHIQTDQAAIKEEQKEIKADVKDIKRAMIKKADLDVQIQLILQAIKKEK